MKFTAKEIADLLQGTVDGDPQIVVDRFSKIEEGSTGSLSFLANPKYEDHLYNTGASVVLVNRDFEPASAVKSTLVRVENAYQALAKLLQLYAENKKKKAGIHASAVIADNARLGENIFIGPLVTIGEGTIVGNGTRIHAGSHIGENVRIGDDSTIHPGVKIYDDCVIGKACTIHGGAIIGADGFGFAPNTENEYQKVPQIGNVVLENMVEIGANTTIDRATMGSTVIRKGAKLDNLIQIAHNVEIGENTVIAAQTGVAGSTKIGSNCMIGGQVGIIGHLHIADEVKIAAQSGIGSDITEKGAIVQGSPAFSIGDYKKSYVVFRRLPALEREIHALKTKI